MKEDTLVQYASSNAAHHFREDGLRDPKIGPSTGSFVGKCSRFPYRNSSHICLGNPCKTLHLNPFHVVVLLGLASFVMRFLNENHPDLNVIIPETSTTPPMLACIKN